MSELITPLGLTEIQRKEQNYFRSKTPPKVKNCRFETLMKEIKLIIIEKNEFENRDMSITEDL